MPKHRDSYIMKLSDNQMGQLCQVIVSLIYEKGLKSTTMDLVAQKLQISKRTLYEIFGSKDEMLAQVIEHLSDCRRQQFDRIIAEAPNVLVAFIRMFQSQREAMSKLSVNFFRDMDRLYQEVRPHYERRKEEQAAAMSAIIRKGIEEGYFRDDVNFTVLARMMEVQMEALKRMENLFPENLSLLEIYDTISLTFIRGIVTQKGHRMLDEIIAGHKARIQAEESTEQENQKTGNPETSGNKQ